VGEYGVMATFNEKTLVDSEWEIFELMRFGGVTLFDQEPILANHLQMLGQRQYVVYEFDCLSYPDDKAILYDVILRLGLLPDGASSPTPAMGLDGFNDFLSDARIPEESGMALVFRNFESLHSRYPYHAQNMLGIFAGVHYQKLLFGWRFMALIHSNDPQIQIEPINGLSAYPLLRKRSFPSRNAK
jgi:hypothetical protein